MKNKYCNLAQMLKAMFTEIGNYISFPLTSQLGFILAIPEDKFDSTGNHH